MNPSANACPSVDLSMPHDVGVRLTHEPEHVSVLSKGLLIVGVSLPHEPEHLPVCVSERLVNCRR